LQDRAEKMELAEKQRTCGHAEWVYEKDYSPFDTYIPHIKTCKSCKKVVGLQKEEWLQEQADLHYTKHEEFISKINALTEHAGYMEKYGLSQAGYIVYN